MSVPTLTRRDLGIQDEPEDVSLQAVAMLVLAWALPIGAGLATVFVWALWKMGEL